MKQWNVRKITAERSGTNYYAVFEDGQFQQPIVLLFESEVRELRREITEALGEEPARETLRCA